MHKSTKLVVREDMNTGNVVYTLTISVHDLIQLDRELMDQEVFRAADRDNAKISEGLKALALIVEAIEDNHEKRNNGQENYSNQ